jgi:riboflavin synthase
VFTGLVQSIGKIVLHQGRNESVRLGVQTEFTDLALGESIAVDGACLTVAAFEGGTFQVDVSPETLTLTLAGTYSLGSRVHLERALRVGDRVGGHWVTGHIDGLLTVETMETRGDCLWVQFGGINGPDRPFLSKKGSVCINGVSLTVNETGPSHFSVLLVPHTLEQTTLAQLTVGSTVNIEWDPMAKMVAQALEQRFAESLKNAHH